MLYILLEASILECKVAGTLMDQNLKLFPDQGELLKEQRRQKELIGKLNYLIMNWSDIAYLSSLVVSACQPVEPIIWNDVITILRHI